MKTFLLWIIIIQIITSLSKRSTITGQNIINCRSFNTQSSKLFDFIGSFKSEKGLPLLSLPEIAFVGRSNVG
jgi:hypothetical protein